jgi:cytochrome c oxidase subunit 4
MASDRAADISSESASAMPHGHRTAGAAGHPGGVAADLAAAGDDHAVDIDRHVRIYVTVFVALMALTIVTVGVSYLHLPVPIAVTVALLVATVKGSLVACYFMHLISEKRLIYAVLLLTGAFFVALLALPAFTQHDGYWIHE